MTKKGVIILFIIVLFLAGIFSGIVAYTLLDFIKISIKEEESSSLSVKVGSNETISVPSVNKSDRVYLILNSSSRISAKIDPAGTLVPLPFDIEGFPFEFEDWILTQQRFCFIANESSNSTIQLSFKDPLIPYITKVFEGDADYTLYKYIDESEDNYIGVYVQALTNQSSQSQQVILIHPYHRSVEYNFLINGSLRLISGELDHITLIIMTKDRNWLPYALISENDLNESKSNGTIDFTLNLYNLTTFGHTFSEDFNKYIQYIAISIGLDSTKWPENDVAYADVGIGNITIYNGDEPPTIIEPYFLENYTVNLDLYVFCKFNPTIAYTVSILILIILVFVGALILARMNGFRFKSQIFKPLITTRATSDPRPDTYLAKLFHKPRYDRFTALVNEFAGRNIDTLIDVGCGKGIFQRWLKQNGVNVKLYIGCDLNASALRENKNMERILCDAQHLPFEPKIAEVVTCSEVLEHVPKPYTGFKEILRVSKRWVFISFPNEKLKNALGFRYSEHISDIGEVELERVAEKKNLALLKREELYFVFPPSVFDKLKLGYTMFYRPIVEALFHLLSKIFRDFSLMTTILLVFEHKEMGQKGLA